MAEPSDKHWHIDRRVPIALLVGIVVQTFAIGWWASGITERLTAVERDQAKADHSAQIRMTALESRQRDADNLGIRVDEQLKAVKEGLTRIESALKPKP